MTGFRISSPSDEEPEEEELDGLVEVVWENDDGSMNMYLMTREMVEGLVHNEGVVQQTWSELLVKSKKNALYWASGEEENDA